MGHSALVAWLREFCCTLEIITRTLREVVNRVRLRGHHTHRSSHGEVHVYGAVMRRGGEGGDQYCIDSVLKTPEERDLLGCLVAGILSHSGDHRAHSARSGQQSEIVRSSQPFRGIRAVKCMCRVWWWGEGEREEISTVMIVS